MPTELIVTSVHLIGLDELRKRSGWYLGLGVLLVVLGTVALASSFLLTMASVLFVACLMVVGGVLQTIHALISKRWGGHFLDLLVGLLSSAVGLMIVANPRAAAAAVTLVIVLFLILGGVFRIALAFAIPFHHVLWLALHGVINLLLGILILQQWPLSGDWVIGLFIGIDMIFNGWSLIILGMAAKRLPAD